MIGFSLDVRSRCEASIVVDTGDPAHFFVNSQNSLSLTASIVLERSDKKQYDYDSHITMFERMTKKVICQ